MNTNIFMPFRTSDFIGNLQDKLDNLASHSYKSLHYTVLRLTIVHDTLNEVDTKQYMFGVNKNLC